MKLRGVALTSRHVLPLNRVFPPPLAGIISPGELLFLLSLIYNRPCVSHVFGFFLSFLGFVFFLPLPCTVFLTALLKKQEYLEKTLRTQVRTPWFLDHESLLRDSYLLSLWSEQTARDVSGRDRAAVKSSFKKEIKNKHIYSVGKIALSNMSHGVVW